MPFLQYPSDLRPEGVQSICQARDERTSDFLQHTYRNMAIRSHRSTQESSCSPRNPGDDAHLGDVTVDPSTLWTGGHSLGAAYTCLVLDLMCSSVVGGNTSWSSPSKPANRPSTCPRRYTQLQTKPWSNWCIKTAGVGVCPGAFHQRLFSELPKERNQLIEVPTDQYGFPRLIASHYLQTDPARDQALGLSSPQNRCSARFFQWLMPTATPSRPTGRFNTSRIKPC